MFGQTLLNERPLLAASGNLGSLSSTSGCCRVSAAPFESRRSRLARQPVFARAAPAVTSPSSERAADWSASTISASSVDAPSATGHASTTFASFDNMLDQSELPVLVDFSTQWCGPCQMMDQVITTLSKRLDGAVSCVRIDCDRYPALASKYAVKALPTLVLFKDGKPIDKVEGYVGIQSLQDRVNYYLGRPMGPGRRYRPV